MGVLCANCHVIGAKRLVLEVILELCHNYAKVTNQEMGQLPQNSFIQVGIDFAGPVTTEMGQVNKPVKVKSCICLCVCF